MENSKSLDDKKGHRWVTAGLLVLGLLIYGIAREGWLGVRMAEFATGYLIFILFAVATRAVLTELGVRRPRYSFWGRRW
jgi:hypothetical protein